HHVERIDGGPGETAVARARRHRADVHARVGRALLHADAVAEQRAAREGARGIDREHADGLLARAQLLDQRVDERTLAGAGRTRDADAPGAPDARVDARQRGREARIRVLGP